MFVIVLTVHKLLIQIECDWAELNQTEPAKVLKKNMGLDLLLLI